MPKKVPIIPEDTQAKPYTASPEEAKRVLDLGTRFDQLQTYRSGLLANPYDQSGKGRTIEQTWGYDDYVALPHKYSHPEMEDWMADESIPMIPAKIETALAVLISKNPEVEITADNKKNEANAKVLDKLYQCSWEKGNGRQQLVKFTDDGIRYGFAVGREYHRYLTQEREEIIGYDPENLKNETETKEVVVHDEAYFECISIRDCWFDHRAKPYDEDSMRDWMWRIEYDKSTFDIQFPVSKYPMAKYVVSSSKNSGDLRSSKDLSETTDSVDTDKVVLYFYENKELNRFIITDKHVILHEQSLLDGELSCVYWFWKKRNNGTIYGVSLPEILEGTQTQIDRMQNMIFNQLVLCVGGSGFYDGQGNVTEKDMKLEPKLKKVRNPEKINFVKIPPPDLMTINMLERLNNQADDVSGVTKSLTGEQIGKTLGEAVLNREAGLKRLSLPLQNLEFALERHARLRIANLQRIYSRPVSTTVIRTSLGVVIDEGLWQEYQAEKAKNGETLSNIYKYPQSQVPGDMTVYRNQFKTERMPFQTGANGEPMASESDQYLEITPAETRGNYGIKVRAFSTIPLSKALDESKAIETFNMTAQLPYTDLYKSESWMLKARGIDPDEIMIPEQQIIDTQNQAAQARSMGAVAPDGGQPGQPVPSEAGPLMPPKQAQQPAASQGLSAQMTPNM